MLKIIASLLVGIIIGSTGVAYGLGTWKQSGRTYSCEGISVSVFCKETNWKGVYSFGIYPGAISVSYRKNLIFHCNRKYSPADNCVYYGP